MAKLTEIIKDEVCGAGQIVRGVFQGAFRGIYTPALMTTSIRQLTNEIDSDDKSVAEITASGIAQVVSTFSIHVPLALYAIQQGRGKEYFGALAATNLIGYLVNTYKRSKE